MCDCGNTLDIRSINFETLSELKNLYDAWSLINGVPPKKLILSPPQSVNYLSLIIPEEKLKMVPGNVKFIDAQLILRNNIFVNTILC